MAARLLFFSSGVVVEAEGVMSSEMSRLRKPVVTNSPRLTMRRRVASGSLQGCNARERLPAMVVVSMRRTDPCLSYIFTELPLT